MRYLFTVISTPTPTTLQNCILFPVSDPSNDVFAFGVKFFLNLISKDFEANSPRRHSDYLSITSIFKLIQNFFYDS